VNEVKTCCQFQTKKMPVNGMVTLLPATYMDKDMLRMNKRAGQGWWIMD
jgi:hypothetical protein